MTTPVFSRLATAVAVLALVASSCGSDGATTTSPPATVPLTDVGSTVSTIVPATSTAPNGWIDGEPDWTGGSDGDAMSEAVMETEAMEAEVSGASEVIDAADERVEPPIVSDQPLRAGSVDDNVDHDGFLAYLDRLTGLGIEGRSLDLSGRVHVTVVDDAGRPVSGHNLAISQSGSTVARVTTTADGTARVFPAVHGLDPTMPVEIGDAVTDGPLTSAEPGSSITLTAPAATQIAPVPLDVLFLLDATGSMGDEIDRLKQTIDTVAERVAALDPRPDIRFAMTLYRDAGDLFVTSTYDFTGDVDAFRVALEGVVADGGGDYPEALDEGLAAALGEPQWRDASQAVQLVFVVADAPPQVTRQLDTPYTESIAEAVARGVKLFPIASSESDDVAELVFRQLAVTTGAPFVFLSYGAGGAATGESTDISSTDYEELPLDELVVRLIAEELGALAGPDAPPPTVPSTTAPPTTNPDGQ